MVVVDASALVVALVDNSEVGRWCRETITGQRLATLRLMPFEVANAFRGLVIHGG